MNATKYGALFDTLKSEILSGKYHSNFPFPSVRALIGRFKLSDRTVRHALDELFAQGLISRKQGRGTFVSNNVASRTIGLVMPDITQSEYFVRIFRELIRVAESRQYKLLFGEIQGTTAKDRATCAERLVNDFIARRVSGVIFQPIEYYADGDDFNRRMLERLDSAHIPVVLCDNDFTADDNRHDIVGTDNVKAGISMYRHLADRGLKRICFFMRPHAPQTHENRFRGMILAKLSGWKGVVRSDELLVCEPDDAVAIRRRLKSSRIDAFMCGDDETAARLMQTLNKLGWTMPGKVAVSGFNDLRIASLLTPSLTTMRIPCEQIAEAAFMRLVTRIGSSSLPPTEILLPVELVVRESTETSCGNQVKAKKGTTRDDKRNSSGKAECRKSARSVW